MNSPTSSSPRGPGRPSQPLAREHLLSAAREVFAERGYAGASMAEIASRVGLRKASLFHHAGSKEALYTEAMSEVVNHLLGQIVAAGQETGSFKQRLDRLGELVVHFLGAHRSAARLLLREMIDGGPYLSSFGREAVQATLDATVAFLDGAKPGAGPGGDPRQIALSIVGLHLFPFAAPVLAGDVLGEDLFSPAAVERRRDAVVDHVRRLCRAAPVDEAAGDGGEHEDA